MQDLFNALKALYQTHDSEIAKSSIRTIEEAEVTDPMLKPQWDPLCNLVAGLKAEELTLSLTSLVLKYMKELHWRKAVSGKLPAYYSDKMAAVELIGPTGMFHNSTGKLGFFLQAPGVYYPSHWHPAEELYYVLNGTSGWSVDDDPLTSCQPETWIHHRSLQPHTMETYQEPLLALWTWSGDLSIDGYEIKET
jgi:hypothetical protein